MEKVESLTLFLNSWPLITNNRKMFTNKPVDRILLINDACIHVYLPIFK